MIKYITIGSVLFMLSCHKTVAPLIPNINIEPEMKSEIKAEVKQESKIASSTNIRKQEIYSREDNNKIFEIQSGTLIRICLPSLYSAGYMWSVDSTVGPVSYLDRQETESITIIPQEIGSESTKIFTFLSTREGRAEINLIMYRPWQPEKIETKYHIEFIIRENK